MNNSKLLILRAIYPHVPARIESQKVADRESVEWRSFGRKRSFRQGRFGTGQKREIGPEPGLCGTGNRFLWGWCPGRELNPHAPFGARDFKSRASASFATRAP